MIRMSEDERSLIAFLQPGEGLAYIDRDGEPHTVCLDASEEASWLHLFHFEKIISGWFGTPTRLQNNIPLGDREAVSRALADLILKPGPAALVRWEHKPRKSRHTRDREYGPPVWRPIGYTLLAIEPQHTEVPQ